MTAIKGTTATSKSLLGHVHIFERPRPREGTAFRQGHDLHAQEPKKAHEYDYRVQLLDGKGPAQSLY